MKFYSVNITSLAKLTERVTAIKIAVVGKKEIIAA